MRRRTSFYISILQTPELNGVFRVLVRAVVVAVGVVDKMADVEAAHTEKGLPEARRKSIVEGVGAGAKEPMVVQGLLRQAASTMNFLKFQMRLVMRRGLLRE